MPGAPPVEKAEFANHAQKVYQAAKLRFETQTNNADAEWQFGQACYDWADYATNDDQREAIALEGIAVCKILVHRDSNSVAGHYYLFMNLGQLAETKTLGALKLLGQMESEMKISLKLDPQYDLAGSDRGLGLLYLEAPGWPLGNGSKSKARYHLQQAVKLSPVYPENQLNLIEAELKWGDHTGALRDLGNLEKLLPEARKQFTGADWASSWADWEIRLESVRKKAAAPVRISPARRSQEN